MSNRLDQEREKELTPVRVEYAKMAIQEEGHDIVSIAGDRIEFLFDGNIIRHYAYSGWHTGKGIQDGRGIHKLIKQIKKE